MNAHFGDFESLPYQRSGIVTTNDLQKQDIHYIQVILTFYLLLGKKSHFQEATEKSHTNFIKFYVKAILPNSY